MTDHPIYHDIQAANGTCGRCNKAATVRCYTKGCRWQGVKLCQEHYLEHDHGDVKSESGQSTAEMGLLAFLTAVLFFVGMQGVGQAIKVAFYATTPAYCDEYSTDKNQVTWHVLDCRTGLYINPPVRIN